MSERLFLMTKYFMMQIRKETDRRSGLPVPFSRTLNSNLPRTGLQSSDTPEEQHAQHKMGDEMNTRMDALQRLLVNKFSFIESKFSFIETLLVQFLAPKVDASARQAAHHEGSAEMRHPANDSRLTKIQETLDKILDRAVCERRTYRSIDDRAVCENRTHRSIGSRVFVVTRSENTFDTSISPDAAPCLTPDPEWKKLEGQC